MSVVREVYGAAQLRETARHLAEAAERTRDPEQRVRLREKARLLRERCERPELLGSGGFPV
ncbi:DUF6381 family protein [Streptomyces sp. OfavH-34-F]|uniref:DUF6381 family protein n=1 Tax=unclassified Streptomyces TaxID=2593676 RepID=UPI001EF387A4|nr:DUF6381 family protein [Streptomyces sp. OfavH-34-F]MCG7525601.1 DUF6381 family protein [Streptomyces sp. OfavH-34-F]